MPLFDSDFLRQLEYLSLVSRRVFRGSLLAQRRTMQDRRGPGGCARSHQLASRQHRGLRVLCHALLSPGQVGDVLQALRRAIRLNPGEPQLILTLASALADQFRTDEAIELYWQAYDKSEAL